MACLEAGPFNEAELAVAEAALAAALGPPAKDFNQRAKLEPNVQRAVKVRDEVVRDLLVALLAEGHVLIEDYPGVGKTALATTIMSPNVASSTAIACNATIACAIASASSGSPV